MKMKKYIVILCCMLPMFAHADERMITVVGEAQKYVLPDQAIINVTVNAKDRDLQKSKLEHDQKLQALFKIAGDMKIERKHLKTQYASVQPQYRYANNEQLFDGYNISTSLQMTIKSMASVGDVLEKLVAAKFDRISNVQYSVSNDLAYRDEVLLNALDNAKEKAGKMAARMSQNLGKPLQISQGYQQHSRPQPMMGRMMAIERASADMAGGGVAPPEGEILITGTVTVSFELKD